MAFNESIKREVKEKAAFRCCRCQSISVEVHHIIPQTCGGEDTIENAAPLCPNCHSDFGDNAIKRKEITHMRDWWYKQVESRYLGNNVGQEQLSQINSQLEDIRNDQTSAINELKSTLKEISNNMIDNLTAETSDITASGIINTATASTTAVKLGDKVYSNMICNNCGTSIGLLIGSNNCPTCGSQIK